MGGGGGGEEWRCECVSVGKSGIFWTRGRCAGRSENVSVCVGGRVWVGRERVCECGKGFGHRWKVCM